MSAGNGAARPVVVRLHPVDVDRGRVDVRATLPPDIVKRAEALADGGAVALAVAGALLAAVAGAGPEPVAAVAARASAVLADGLEGVRAAVEGAGE